MTDKERKAREAKACKRVTEAVLLLPDERRTRILGWAEGVIDATQSLRQKDDRAG